MGPDLKPGELKDKKGIPVYPGDLLKSYHFRCSRRHHYLYHVVTERDGKLYASPVEKLHTGKTDGECLLCCYEGLDFEVIAGHGPRPSEIFYERKIKNLS